MSPASCPAVARAVHVHKCVCMVLQATGDMLFAGRGQTQKHRIGVISANKKEAAVSSQQSFSLWKNRLRSLLFLCLPEHAVFIQQHNIQMWADSNLIKKGGN